MNDPEQAMAYAQADFFEPHHVNVRIQMFQYISTPVFESLVADHCNSPDLLKFTCSCGI
jgi:hypothetical protein